jgi:hypothetical protein
MLEEGKFGHEDSFEYEWPVALDEVDDFSKILVECRLFFENTKSAGRICQTACAALRHGYGRLLDLCMTLGLRGTVASTGSNVEINAVELSRPSAWINVRNGDLLERTSDGKFFPRWTGLSFLDGSRGALSGPLHNVVPRSIADPSIAPASTFHVKCTEPDGIRSDTIERRTASPKKSIVRIERNKAVIKDCIDWLVPMMRASMNERPKSKQAFWSDAQARWPSLLSHRSFLGAWTAAIEISGAIAWGAPGAPRKSRRKSPR